MTILIIKLLFIFRCFGESAPPANAIPPSNLQVKNLAVLSTNESGSFGLAVSLQQALANLYQQTQYYNVQIVNQPLPAFTELEINKLYATLKTNLLSFAYLEAERITLFLFDSTRPKDFISASQGLIDPMLGNEVNPQVVEYKFRVCFNQLLSLYYQGQFQPLPSSQNIATSENETDDPVKRAEISRRLFKELASLNDGRYSIGASIGMARFTGETGSASNVNFGGLVGYSLSEKLNLEGVLDIFQYVTASLSLKYRFLLKNRYLSLYGSLNAGKILGTIMGPRSGLGIEEPSLPSGGTVFGPGFTFDVPLLGASLRGDIRLLFGSGLLILGNYGLVYNF